MSRIIVCSVCKKSKICYSNNMCSSCYRKDWLSKNPDQLERIKAYQKRHYQENRIKVLNRASKNYFANRERIVKRHKAWDKNNREKKREYWRKYYSSRPSLKIRSNTMLEESKSKYGSKCVYCGESNVKLEIDHILPLSRGGKDNQNNIVPCCKPCNAKKGSKTIKEWINDRADSRCIANLRKNKLLPANYKGG